ncbi:MAG TPA: hypothetical protein VL523_20385, partial [Terriglobia bacterium]|nr:hypothetical protein [Terriglobia bacterium]
AALGGLNWAGTMTSNVEIIRDWDSDIFHRRVLELEAKGYTARRDTYRITAEMNPETGEVIHLHTIELLKPKSDD